jgi:hypothetical protein
MIKNVHRSSCKVPAIFVHLNETSIFLTNFRKNTQISDFFKIRPVGAELFHADGHDEADSRFSQFCERA